MLQDQNFFDTLSDETRRRLLALLFRQGELCVCELQYAVDMPQPKISRHLAVMREAEVLAVRREGTWIYYRLHPGLPLWAYRIVEAMTQSISQSHLFDRDAARLEEMANRPARCSA